MKCINPKDFKLPMAIYLRSLKTGNLRAVELCIKDNELKLREVPYEKSIQKRD